MKQLNDYPFDAMGVKFSLLLKSNVTFKNGSKTTILTFVPNELDYDNVMAGVLQALRYDSRAESVQHDIFELKPGQPIELIGYSIKRKV